MDFELVAFIAIGFLAQIIDGALGMAFGVVASSSLLAILCRKSRRRVLDPSPGGGG
jgi:uncharacterized membrane protein YfcA